MGFNSGFKGLNANCVIFIWVGGTGTQNFLKRYINLRCYLNRIFPLSRDTVLRDANGRTGGGGQR